MEADLHRKDHCVSIIDETIHRMYDDLKIDYSKSMTKKPEKLIIFAEVFAVNYHGFQDDESMQSLKHALNCTIDLIIEQEELRRRMAHICTLWKYHKRE